MGQLKKGQTIGLNKGNGIGAAGAARQLTARRALLAAGVATLCFSLAGCAAVPTPLSEPMRLGRVQMDGQLMFAGQEPIRGQSISTRRSPAVSNTTWTSA